MTSLREAAGWPPAPPAWLLLHLHPLAGGWETQEGGCPRQAPAALETPLLGFLTCRIPPHSQGGKGMSIEQLQLP